MKSYKKRFLTVLCSAAVFAGMLGSSGSGLRTLAEGTETSTQSETEQAEENTDTQNENNDEAEPSEDTENEATAPSEDTAEAETQETSETAADTAEKKTIQFSDGGLGCVFVAKDGKEESENVYGFDKSVEEVYFRVLPKENNGETFLPDISVNGAKLDEYHGYTFEDSKTDKWYKLTELEDNVSVSAAPTYPKVDREIKGGKMNITITGLPKYCNVYYCDDGSDQLSAQDIIDRNIGKSGPFNDGRCEFSGLDAAKRYPICVEDYSSNTKIFSDDRDNKPIVTIKKAVLVNNSLRVWMEVKNAKNVPGGKSAVTLNGKNFKLFKDGDLYCFLAAGHGESIDGTVEFTDMNGSVSDPVEIDAGSIPTMKVTYDTNVTQTIRPTDGESSGEYVEVRVALENTSDTLQKTGSFEFSADDEKTNEYVAKVYDHLNKYGAISTTGEDNLSTWDIPGDYNNNNGIHIDNESPVVDVTGPDCWKENETSSVWANEKNITVRCEDNYKESPTVYYRFGDAGKDKTLELQGSEGKIPLPESSYNGKVMIWALDTAGNKSQEKTVYVKYDPVKPYIVQKAGEDQITIEVIDKGIFKKLIDVLTGAMTTGEFYLTLNAADIDSGVKSVEYAVFDAENESKLQDWTAIGDHTVDADGNFAISRAKCEYKGNCTANIHVRLTDKAGNIKEYESNGQEIMFDDSVPEFRVDMTREKSRDEYMEGTWTNENVHCKCVPNEDTVGQSSVYYGYGDNKPTNNPNFVMGSEGKTSYEFFAVSGAGNKSDVITKEIWIDTADPKKPGVFLNGVDLSNINSNWISDENGRNKCLKLSIKNEFPSNLANTAPEHIYYNIAFDGDQPEDEKELFDGKEHEYTGELTLSGDGVYTISAWIKDEAGNVSETFKKTIRQDNNAPVIKSVRVLKNGAVISDGKPSSAEDARNNITYDNVYRSSIKIAIDVDNDVSGIKTVEYKLINSLSTSTGGDWIKYDRVSDKGENGFEYITLPIEPDRKFNLAIRAIDEAGNGANTGSYVYTDGIILDSHAPVGNESTAPDITITPSPTDHNGFYNKDMSVSINVVDPGYIESVKSSDGCFSGLQNVKYKVISDGTVTDEGTLLNVNRTEKSDKFDQKYSGTVHIPAAANNSNDVRVEVTAADRAGNVRTTITPENMIKIDITAPVINVSYDNNSSDGKYFKNERVAEINITERNFDPADVVINAANSSGESPSISGWSSSGEGDGRVNTAYITYSSDGDYTFDMSYTDEAGNSAGGVNYADGTVAPDEFTIDRTAPTISVTYDNNSVQNGKYFSKNRTATIVINERNFDSSRVKITASASGAAVPASGLSWSGGDSHTATITYDKDGEYTFDITCTDMAGNESGEANYSGASPKNFVIDKTIKAADIRMNGKNAEGKSFNEKPDGKPFNYDAILKVVAEDKNFAQTEYKLTRTRFEKKDEDVTAKFMKSSSTTLSDVFDKFEKVPENDGIYTLTVTVVDKAGNKKSETVKFTINRYGSVYEYNDVISGLMKDGGRYVQGVDEDLVITEYNPDKLIKDGLNIVLTRDGQAVAAEELKKTVEPQINANVEVGEKGWYQYKYVISSENFDSDGVYKLTLSSEDEASNISENTSNANTEAGNKNKDIMFRVDTTAPEFTNISGLEQSIVNADSCSVDYDVYDAIGLKSVTVYVDGTVASQKMGQDISSSMNKFSGSFILREKSNAQKVRVVAEDLAGNVTDTDSDDFDSAFDFVDSVTVSTSFAVRLWANKPLLFGAAGAVALAGVGIAAAVVAIRRKRKNV